MVLRDGEPFLQLRDTGGNAISPEGNMMAAHECPRIVIVGAGFGGLYAARAFNHAAVQLTVIDRQNYHLFQPLLYQVATAGLSPSDIAYPIRSVLRKQNNARVVQAQILAIKPREHRVMMADGVIDYDYLIVATGAGHSYFGHSEWEKFAPGLKSVTDALAIRRRILGAFEQAEREPDAARRRAWLTFVIVGGGSTGLELAGAVAELAFKVMVEDFRRIDSREARVILLQAMQRVLPTYPEALSAEAERALRGLGVEVRTNTAVTAIQPGWVAVGEERIPTATVLWAAGVEPSPLAHSLGVPLDHAGRVLVEPDLSIPGHPEVFVIGDLAACVDQTGHPLPGLAAVAVQQGHYVARHILNLIQGRPGDPFRYVDRGTLATIGRGKAVADFRVFRMSGFWAWVAWLAVHLFLLIGFRNRFLVLFKWTWALMTSQHGARIMIDGTEILPAAHTGVEEGVAGTGVS
ncbi:MAG TPA: NAD(P)/FAD-dependent oxidoreductase [Nitrospira sp.]|nr:NAD(P)/FAD-dependent oxidoreductase [Nitrospira sp.]